MKLSKITLAFLILCGSGLCYGQDLPPQSILVDRFSHESCESVFARVDNLLAELQRDPSSQAYVIIYPAKDRLEEGFKNERRIKAQIASRNFDTTRITFVRGESRLLTQVDLWQLPAGANTPIAIKGAWGKQKFDLSKPFIFYTEYPDNACPTFLPEEYTGILQGDPTLNGHIVIFNKSGEAAQAEADRWLKIFMKDNKIARSRLKIFFSKSWGPLYQEVEFWIVPSKKKNNNSSSIAPRWNLLPVKTG